MVFLTLKKIKKSLTGQSLIELLAALAVIGLVVLALVVTTTISVRNSSFAKTQTVATKYAQEAIEKIRGHRDATDWETFVEDCNAETVPLPSLPPLYNLEWQCRQPGVEGSDCDADDEKCEVIVNVSWEDSKGAHEVPLTTYFSNWQLAAPQCDGCWDGPNCVEGTLNTKCGLNGVACVDCVALHGFGYICINGECEMTCWKYCQMHGRDDGACYSSIHDCDKTGWYFVGALGCRAPKRYCCCCWGHYCDFP